MKLAEVFVCTPTDFLGMKLGKLGTILGKQKNTLLKYGKFFGEFLTRIIDALRKGRFFDTKKPLASGMQGDIVERNNNYTDLSGGDGIAKVGIFGGKRQNFWAKLIFENSG